MGVLAGVGGTLKRSTSAWGDRPHNSASRDQAFRGWNPGLGSADSDQEWDRDETRSRARDLDRNESLATSYLNEHAKLIALGKGLLPNPRPDHLALGWSKAKADAFAALAKRLAHGYLLSANVDASRKGGIGQLQRLSLRSRALSGGVLILPIWKEDDRFEYSTCFHLVEYDRLSNPNNMVDQRLLRAGVEIDVFGDIKFATYAGFRPVPTPAFFGAVAANFGAYQQGLYVAARDFLPSDPTRSDDHLNDPATLLQQCPTGVQVQLSQLTLAPSLDLLILPTMMNAWSGPNQFNAGG